MRYYQSLSPTPSNELERNLYNPAPIAADWIAIQKLPGIGIRPGQIRLAFYTIGNV